MTTETPNNTKPILQNNTNNTNNTNIFKQKQNFNTEKDLKQKAEKYNIEIISDYTEKGEKKTVNDFILYFNKRLQYFTNLLQDKIDTQTLTRISNIKELSQTNTNTNQNKQITIIGLISKIEQTKQKHTILTLEDKGGEIKCFINKNQKTLQNKTKTLCLDEGIAIKGSIGKDIIWTENIITPTPPQEKPIKKTKNENYILCTSNLQIGTETFTKNSFQKLIKFLNKQTKNEKLNKIANKIKYIIIAGDIIEGTKLDSKQKQEQNTQFLTTELQYQKTAELLSQIPQEIAIIIIPGNHDTTRLSEPQPKIPYKKAYALYNLPNVVMLSNPSTINLFKNDKENKLNLFLYHGKSIFYYANNIEQLREKGGTKNPEETIKFLIDKRHLSPSHGSIPYIPDSQQDPLTIKTTPDFFITGNTDKTNTTNYKGCTIITNSSWTKTNPDIGKCFLTNTQTRKTHTLNFYTKKHKQK